jgi:hypothetical protein
MLSCRLLWIFVLAAMTQDPPPRQSLALDLILVCRNQHRELTFSINMDEAELFHTRRWISGKPYQKSPGFLSGSVSVL